MREYIYVRIVWTRHVHVHLHFRTTHKRVTRSGSRAQKIPSTTTHLRFKSTASHVSSVALYRLRQSSLKSTIEGAKTIIASVASFYITSLSVHTQIRYHQCIISVEAVCAFYIFACLCFRGFLKSDKVLGSISIKLQALENQCVVHDSYDVSDAQQTNLYLCGISWMCNM